MKVLAIVIITMGLIGLSFVNAPSNSSEGINFQSISFQEALKKAKKEKKLIFVDAYAVWCGPCKWMEANTFREKEVGDAFNKKFVNLKIDMEKGEGPELARKYNVRAYPTLLLIDGDGQVVKRIVGLQKKEKLLSEVEEYLN
jgi:thiol:disulfide interchange protein